MSVEGILRRKGRKVFTVSQAAPVPDAVDQMKRDKVGALVVSDDGHVIQGIISERDILDALASYGTGLWEMPVRDIMTKRVESCRPEDSLKQIMSVMTQRRFRHMPVADENGLCGMVSIGDVVVQRLEGSELETQVAREALILSRYGIPGPSAGAPATTAGLSVCPAAAGLRRGPRIGFRKNPRFSITGPIFRPLPP